MVHDDVFALIHVLNGIWKVKDGQMEEEQMEKCLGQVEKNNCLHISVQVKNKKKCK